ncbi:helix-turn-helix transcriptional regulator [Oceanibaculum pacificum]|uniref:DNA-binding protein n=1 Tax=Oceanibaculum pacificum TaxID=580166 RepID=A0A154VPW7_9PROT|nr:helix-turn-helix transcriptional regulator [Oceanibaculum pacificum]KZD03397.1 hypothetical protein AUP43_13075 [Oceanibaculum pacificum]
MAEKTKLRSTAPVPVTNAPVTALADQDALMTVPEVARFLRVQNRTVYDLVRTQRIPFCRIGGKLLFPRPLIQRWIVETTDYPGHQQLFDLPQVIAGSHEPLLEWAVRESNSSLAIIVEGSLAGINRLASGGALAAGTHLADPGAGDYNLSAVFQQVPVGDIVVIEWAWRQQGMIVAPDNPLGLASVTDIKQQQARIAMRQAGSGSNALLEMMLADADIDPAELNALPHAERTQYDLGACIADGRADVGIGIEAVARRFRLGFVPLRRERFDLVVQRWAYFEPPLQALFAFTRSPDFVRQAEMLGGYDVGDCGRVIYNPRPLQF